VAAPPKPHKSPHCRYDAIPVSYHNMPYDIAVPFCPSNKPLPTNRGPGLEPIQNQSRAAAGGQASRHGYTTTTVLRTLSTDASPRPYRIAVGTEEQALSHQIPVRKFHQNRKRNSVIAIIIFTSEVNCRKRRLPYRIGGGRKGGVNTSLHLRCWIYPTLELSSLTPWVW